MHNFFIYNIYICKQIHNLKAIYCNPPNICEPIIFTFTYKIQLKLLLQNLQNAKLNGHLLGFLRKVNGKWCTGLMSNHDMHV
jgi:hypothetical protein